MTTRSRFWRPLVVPLVVCATGLATVGIAVPSANAAKPGVTKTVPVQELSSVVLQLIRTVEGSTLPCETRNSVVQKLRLLDDALLSGRRSAAQALATAWRQDAWTMEAARVIGPELGSSLQNRLTRMQGQIGSGYEDKPGPTMHWKPLPICETTDVSDGSSTGVASGSGVLASAEADLVGSYNSAADDPMAIVKAFLKAALGIVGGFLNIVLPGIGSLLSSLLSGMVDLLWPNGTGTGTANLFQELIDAATYSNIQTDVDNLGGKLESIPFGWTDQYATAQQYCLDHGGFDSYDCINKARGLWGSWSGIYGDFLGLRNEILQQADQVKLLPLFAQYENLFMSFLRDGIELHPYWTDHTTLNKDWTDLDWSKAAGGPVPLVAMDWELNPNYVDPGTNKPDRGVGYVNSVYQTGLAQHQSSWTDNNAYIRDMTLKVLDFRDMWKYEDPRAYPDGVPGGVKLIRMIYSDPVGEAQATPSLPANVAGPLKELSVWTEQVPTLKFGATKAISAVQATSPPLLGPAQSGAITGGDQPANRVGYYDLGARGPIIKAKAASDKRLCFGDVCPMEPVWIGEEYATGASTGNGYLDPNANVHAFSYDGEVLATVQSVSHYSWSGMSLTDSVVFGFRYADSYDPAGVAIGVGSGKCLSLSSFTTGTPAVISGCNNPPSGTQLWTYDPGLQQLSVTNVWNGLKECLGVSYAGAPVIGYCDDGAASNGAVSSQRWSLDAVGAGIAKITNVRTGLVLGAANSATADGTPLVLSGYSGNTAQQWKASDPLTGELHGIGSGRCVDVPGASTTAGTQVQLYQCNGGVAQQWTYNPGSKQLIYAAHPSLCLEARGGGTTSGTAVQINTCGTAQEQKWSLHGNGGTISNDKSGLVMEARSGATGNGTLVQLYTSNGTAAQQWSRTSTPGGALYAVGAGKCLDLPSSTWSNGTRVVIHSCASPLSAAQTWTYHPIAQTFTVTSPTGPMCLDTAGGATTAGTAVVINACTGAASQRWARNFGNSTITNVNSVQYKSDGSLLSAMVLGVTGDGTADGTPVQLTQSVGETGNLLTPVSSQQWVWSLS